MRYGSLTRREHLRYIATAHVCVRARTQERVAEQAIARNARGFPPDFPIPHCGIGDPTPPFQIQQACLSLLTKAPLFDAPLSTRDACPQQAGLADGAVMH